MTPGSNHAGSSRITRRRLLRTAAATVAGAGLAYVVAPEVAPEVAPQSEAAQKVPKKAVNYQDSPMDGKRCAGCTFYKEGGSCEKVEGEISPDGWCALWAPKEG